MLGWTQMELVEASGLSKVTIAQFEKGVFALREDSARALAAAFSRADIEFPDQHGVRKRTDHVQILRGDDALKLLWDDIFFVLKGAGGEVLISNVDEKRTLDAEPQALMAQLKRLQEHGITERLLSCDGDGFFLMPKECYRWISKELFTFGTSTYVYADRVAFQIWGESMIVLIQSKEAHEGEKKKFEEMWKNAKIPN